MSRTINKSEKINNLENIISELNDSLDYIIDNFDSLEFSDKNKILVKLENCYLNTYSTCEWLNYSASRSKRRIRVVRIDDGDHLVIKCSKKKQNQAIKEELTFALTEEGE